MTTSAIQEVVTDPPGALPWPEVEGVHHRFAEVRGAAIHYAEAGEGEPVVLLHGWPQHWWSWREVIGPLSVRYRVICPDIRGLGWSEGSSAGYRFHDLAADLIGLLDALAIERARLVGTDWGAAAGYSACLRRPDRIAQYVATAGVTLWSADGAPPALWARAWHIYVLALIGDLATTKLGIPEHALHSWRHVGKFSPEEEQTYLGPLRRDLSVSATTRFYRSLVFKDLPYYVRNYKRMRLHVPTLHLNGEHDPLTIGVPDTYGRYTDDMRLDLIPDCGHFIAEERPEALLDRIIDFFAR
jgi:pimeloyl-ACP methyl ester carboxylesterase